MGTFWWLPCERVPDAKQLAGGMGAVTADLVRAQLPKNR